MSGVVSVLVADGQRLFADALSRSLRHRPDLDVVHDAARTGDDVVDALARLTPHVALVDYRMPGLDGPAVARAAASSAPRVKVLLLSWVHGPDEIHEALAARAVGFLPKSLTLDQVVGAIHQAAAGRPLVYADELAALVEGFDRRIDDAGRRTRLASALTAREVELLVLLAEGREAKEVAQYLGISTGTLKNHVHNILTKTGTRTRLEAVRFAYSTGLIRAAHGARPPRSH